MENLEVVKKSVKLDLQTASALEKLALKNGHSLSEEIRIAIKNHLKMTSNEESIDIALDLANEILASQINKLGNRLASLLNRNTIISASAYYANIALLTEILSSSTNKKFEDIEKNARKYALAYANSKNNQALVDFVKDTSLEEVNKAMKETNDFSMNHLE